MQEGLIEQFEVASGLRMVRRYKFVLNKVYVTLGPVVLILVVGAIFYCLG